MNNVRLEKLNVSQLRENLRELGLDDKGKKPLLVKRLKLALKEKATNVDTEASSSQKTDEINETEVATDISPSQTTNEVEMKEMEISSSQDSFDVGLQSSNEAEMPEINISDRENSFKSIPFRDRESEITNLEETTIKCQSPILKTSKDVAKFSDSKFEDDIEEKFGIDQHLEDSKMFAIEDAVMPRVREKRHFSPHQNSERYRHCSPKPKIQSRDSSPDNFDNSLVGLDSKHSDLNLVISKSHLSAKPLSAGGFAYMYAGARATYGITAGKIAFQIKVSEKIQVDLPLNEKEKHEFRVGFSASCSSLQLGEDKFSYGYADSGHIFTDSSFSVYSYDFEPNDVITAFLNMDDATNIFISFAKNGIHLGNCFTINKKELGENVPLFPHVLTRNCSFEIYFGQGVDAPFEDLPNDFSDYVFLGHVPLNKRVASPFLSDEKHECEMIMLSGLPGSGKTTWASKYANENRDKYYNILGASSIIEKMNVNGVSRWHLYPKERENLFSMASNCLKYILKIASQRPRNYILDQTNLYASAQQRKMKQFDGFIRKAIVIMPCKTDFQARCQKQKNEGTATNIYKHALLDMKANLHFPEEGQLFSSVTFVELNKTDAEALAKIYKMEASEALKRRQRYHAHDRHSRFNSKYHQSRFQPDYRQFVNNRNSFYMDNRRGRGAHARNYQWRSPLQTAQGTSYGESSCYYGEPNPWVPGGYNNQY